MKKILILIFLLSFSFAQAQTDDKETLKQINQQVIAAYQNQKLDDAAKFAQQAIELSLKVYGRNNQETAVAYTNLGLVNRDRRKIKESIENLQESVSIYENISGLKSNVQIRAYENLAYSQSLGGKKKEAELTYLKAIDISENKFGRESKESYSPILNLANFYGVNEQFEKADELYLKAYALATKKFVKTEKKVEQVDDARVCSIGKQVFKADVQKNFNTEREKILGENIEDGAVLNSKAKLLPKPTYPSEAKSRRIGGSVIVKVKVDEQGNVFELNTVCGNGILARATEEAVKQAKFETILKEGKPIKYSGYVTYNYEP